MAIGHASLLPYGKLLGTALTGTYQTVLNVGDDAIIVQVFNSCNENIIVSFDSGTTDHVELDGESYVLDLQTNDLRIAAPIIQVKHAGTVPTSGSVRITAIKARLEL